MSNSKPSKRPRFEFDVTLLLPKDLLGYLLSFLQPREVCATRVCRAWRDNKASYRKMKGLIEHVFAVCAPGSLRNLTCTAPFRREPKFEYLTFNLAPFTRLESLKLEWCTITDAQIAPLAFVTLTTLKLGHCSGITAEGLSRVNPSKMRVLDLSAWQLSAQIVRCIARMKNLSTLVLMFCSNLMTADLKELSRMPRLTQIDLSNQNDAKKTSVMPLGNAAKLEVLYLKHCSFVRSSAMVDFINLANLHTLSLFCCNVKDKAIKCLPRNLRALELSYCAKLTSNGIGYLAEATPQLRHLLMSSGPHNKKSISAISKLTELRTLDISQSYAQKQSCLDLISLINLEKLAVSPDRKSMKKLLLLTSLKRLDLVGCGLTKKDVGCFLSLPNLEVVCCVGRKFVPGTGIERFNDINIIVTNSAGQRVFQ